MPLFLRSDLISSKLKTCFVCLKAHSTSESHEFSSQTTDTNSLLGSIFSGVEDENQL